MRIPLLILCALPLFAAATEIPEKDWERIDLDDEHTSIEAPDKSRRYAAISTDTAGDLVVPTTLKGLKVVSIGKQAFYDCSKLTSVVIPEGVTNIADQAFWNCSSLTNVIFPSSLKSIGPYAFAGCQGLKRIEAVAGMFSVGDRAFRDCDGLISVAISADVLSIGEKAFFGCGGLKKVTMSAKRLFLADAVFSGGKDCGVYDEADKEVPCGLCSSLTNVSLVTTGSMTVGASVFNDCLCLETAEVLTDSTATFGTNAFYNCVSLREVVLPKGLTGVSTNMFCNCRSLTDVSLSSNVTTIAYRAFDTCSGLKSLALVEGLRTIEGQAFYGCTSLAPRLTIPQSVSSIGARAFEHCESLRELVICSGDTNCFAAGSVMIGDKAFYANASLTNVVLSQTVTSLGGRAFAECTALASVNLPTTLVEVAESLFESCEALEKIDLPVTLRDIGKTAFLDCTNLVTFTIPTNNVVTIGSKAFWNTRFWNEWPDNSLVVKDSYILGFKGNPTEVALPENCRAIPGGMFEGMTSLTNVTGLTNVVTVGARAFAGSGVRSLDFSQSLQTLGLSAFVDCSNLVSCVLSEAVTAVPDDAFRRCISLTSMHFPSNVVTIGNSSFRDCTSLATLSGGWGVKIIGDYAFAGCVALQPFRFPEDVTYGDHVFQSVEWTENVLFPSLGTLAEEYPNSYSNIRSVVMSASLTSVVDRACANCTSLEWVKFPERVSSVGESAFSGCISLTSVVFNAGLSRVGADAFKGCSSVSNFVTSGQVETRQVFPDAYAGIVDISLVSGATTLCSNALAGCSSVRSFEIVPTVKDVGQNAFAGCVGLTAIEIPESVASIGSFAFDRCSNLVSVTISCAGATVGSGLFAGCPEIRSVTTATSVCFSNAFPEVYANLSSVKLLEGMPNLVDSAFEGCKSLASIRIPTTVSSIGDSAFAECVNLPSSIIIPASVEQLGDFVFSGCRGLTSVNYFGACPEVGSDLYAGTTNALHSAVLKDKYSSWDGESPAANPAAKFWPAFPNAGGRRVVIWAPTDEELRDARMLRFYHYDQTGDRDISLATEGLGVEPERADYDFLGWYTMPYGGVKVTEENFADLEVIDVYAHWVRNREGHEDPQTREDVPYDASRAHVYDGYLLDGDVIAGTIQVKTEKGRLAKSDGTTVTNVTMTATVVVLGEGKKKSVKLVAEDVSSDGGQAETAEGKAISLSLDFDGNDMTGDCDGYEVVAVRNLFGEETDWDRRAALAAVEDFGGTYGVALASSGDSPLASGYAAMTVTVGSKGKSKTAGVLPDGTKFSSSGQLIVGPDGLAVVPVVVPLYAGKKGGFGFVLQLEQQEDASVGCAVDCVSDWVANPGGKDEFTASLETVDVAWGAGQLSSDALFSAEGDFDIPEMTVETQLLPTDVAIAVKGGRWSLPKADKVKFDKEREAWAVLTEYGNPSGLKLSYVASTGAFKGSFSVFAVSESGKSKKYTAQVNGVLVNGTGYGTATIKKIGSVPVTITEGF